MPRNTPSLWEELNSTSNVTYLPSQQSSVSSVSVVSHPTGTTVEYYTRQISQLQMEVNVLKRQNSAVPTQIQQDLNALRIQLQSLREQDEQKTQTISRQAQENQEQADTIDRQVVENNMLKELLGKCKGVFDSITEKSHDHAITHDELNSELSGAGIDFNQIDIG